MKRVLWAVTMFSALVVLLSACGGGGGTTTPPVGKTISGVAAAGAPIIGSVTIKDSKGIEKTVTIAADGKYTVNVGELGLIAPYMVRADGYVGGNEYHLYSAATSADEGGTINITPLTDLIVANIANTIASDYFNSGNFSTLTATELTTEATALRTKLLPVLQAVGVSDSIDLLRASFSTNHTGLDAALDVLRVETTDTTTGAATITNIITNQQIASNDASVLTDTTGVATGVSDIQAISAGFSQFSALFATSLPSETNATLLGLFDTSTFLMEGQNFASFLTQMTTDKSMIGISFTNISLVAGTAEMTDGKMTRVQVAFDAVQNGAVLNDGPKPFWMIKKADGKWYMQGDQLIAHVKVEAVAEYRTSNNNNSIVTGLRLNIEDRGGKGVTSAVVTGAGLPAGGVTLTNNIAFDYFSLNTQSGDNLYVMDDSAIGGIADTGELYTVKLYTGTALSATYTETLKKRPYLSTQLTA
ncbi:MAG: hypothetical protein PHH28_15415, partial [Desulfuromonadaceae bacterium]|nr:hypothetical protein [Desulfuromonadaceae bacterium]